MREAAGSHIIQDKLWGCYRKAIRIELIQPANWQYHKNQDICFKLICAKLSFKLIDEICHKYLYNLFFELVL